MLIGRRSQELLPLADIELAVGLKLRIPHHFGRRRCRRDLAHFVIADANAETPVLLLQQRLLHHLIDDLVTDLLLVLARHRRRARLLAVLLSRDLDALLVFVDLVFSAVDAEDHVAAGTEDAHDLTNGQPGDERNGEDVKDPLRVRVHRAHQGHCDNSSTEGGKGHKSKNDNGQTQAHRSAGHLTAAAAKHYIRPIPT